jgi:hypothetical protein
VAHGRIFFGAQESDTPAFGHILKLADSALKYESRAPEIIANVSVFIIKLWLRRTATQFATEENVSHTFFLNSPCQLVAIEVRRIFGNRLRTHISNGFNAKLLEIPY